MGIVSQGPARIRRFASVLGAQRPSTHVVSSGQPLRYDLACDTSSDRGPLHCRLRRRVTDGFRLHQRPFGKPIFADNIHRPLYNANAVGELHLEWLHVDDVGDAGDRV